MGSNALDSASESKEEKSNALLKALTAMVVELDAARVETQELLILGRCKKAMAMGVGIVEGMDTMLHAICDLLQ